MKTIKCCVNINTYIGVEHHLAKENSDSSQCALQLWWLHHNCKTHCKMPKFCIQACMVYQYHRVILPSFSSHKGCDQNKINSNSHCRRCITASKYLFYELADLIKQSAKWLRSWQKYNKNFQPTTIIGRVIIIRQIKLLIVMILSSWHCHCR
jgi:hypothetical protein